MVFGPNSASMPQEVSVSFAPEPVDNVLHSMFLLSVAEETYGFDPWTLATVGKLTPDQRFTNQTLFMGWDYGAFLKIRSGGQSWLSFSDYLDDLAAQDPVGLRDVIVSEFASSGRQLGVHIPDAGMLVSDLDFYMACIDAHLRHESEDFPRPPFKEAHALLNDPERLLATAVSHFGVMWDEWLAPEWARTLPSIQASVEAFRRLDYSGLTVHEAIRRVTGRDVSAKLNFEEIAHVKQLIFVPSPHCGPYLTWMVDEDIMRVIFGMRTPPEPAGIGHVELLMLLDALGDDVRLRILALLAENDELCSQDIMEYFGLSQSTTSRHLSLLSVTGLVTEERRGGAKKCYQLNRARVGELLQTLRESLVG